MKALTQQGPSTPPSGRLPTQFTPWLTPGLPGHRQGFGMVPLVASRGCGSPLLPLISWEN